MSHPATQRSSCRESLQCDPHRGLLPSLLNGYHLSAKEAAEILGVSDETLKRWVREGRVRAWKTPGGWWRFRTVDLEAFVESTVTGPDNAA